VISYACRFRDRASGNIVEFFVTLTRSEFADVENECRRRDLTIEEGFWPVEHVYLYHHANCVLGGKWRSGMDWGTTTGYDILQEGFVRLPVGRQRWQ
jgi:hypothetical protein